MGTRPSYGTLIEKDKIGEKCGVVAIWDSSGEAVFNARKALAALQHRGQESAGITVYKKTKGLVTVKGMGLVAHVLTDDMVRKLGVAKSAIGHNRYSTTGKSSLINAHPIYFKNKKYAISLGHNGNIPDISGLIGQLKNPPKASSDSALLAALLLENRQKYSSWLETIKHTLYGIKGAFCLVIMVEDGSIFAVRDQYGIRPLCYGKIAQGWAVVSESVGIDVLNGQYIREVKPGEIVSIDKKGAIQSVFFGEPKRQMFCLFEHIYFSRADSYINGMRISTGREALGRSLGKRIRNKGLPVDVVIPIFNSGYYAAKGVSEELGLPFVEAVVTSNYYGRTFIHPDPKKRVTAVSGKHNFVPDEIHGKRVIFIDDSAVRLTTGNAIVKGLLHAGAKEVYAGFACPPIINPCDLGIDMKSKTELLASQWEDEPLEQIEKHVADFIGAHGLIYLPLEDTIKALGKEKHDFYSYYFGGLHPLRGKQEVFPKKSRALNNEPRIVVLISGSGTNLQRIIDQTQSGAIAASIVQVIANSYEANGLQRAKKYHIPTSVISSRGIFKDLKKRQSFNKKLLQMVEDLQPDILVLAGWMLVLSDEFLSAMQNEEVPVINIHPALLTENNHATVSTSRGVIPVIRGAHAISDAYTQDLSISGVTVHQILAGSAYDTGPIVLQEEVRRIKEETLEQWEARIHETEYRILPAAIKRIMHVMLEGIDTSSGKYPW